MKSENECEICRVLKQLRGDVFVRYDAVTKDPTNLHALGLRMAYESVLRLIDAEIESKKGGE